MATLDLPLPAVPARSAPIATLRSWTPWHLPNAALLGHATVTFGGGWTVNSIPIFRRADGSLSAGPPSAPQVDRDGRQRTDANGKRMYAAVIVFESTTARERWNCAVLAALEAAGIGVPAVEDAR